jgi:cytochrome c oxidase subunit III
MSTILIDADRRAKQGAWLFLISLGIFFFSSMLLFVLYVAARLDRISKDVKAYTLPADFLWSTFVLLGVSLALHHAVLAARKDHTLQVLRLCWLASGFAAAFFFIQSHAMYQLVNRALDASVPGLSPYSFTFVLALVHALHVVGGVIALVSVCGNAWRRNYDHERHWGLEFCAMYWHFLDGVWIIMLVGFAAAVALIHR